MRVDRDLGDLPREDIGGAAGTDGRRDRSGSRDSGAAERLVGAVAGALGFAPTARLTGPVGRLPGDLVTNLFAVVGEALTNVARHAHAESAGVDIAVTADAVTACVLDDGIGLAAAPRRGGLTDLRRRAAWHGGTLTVRPGAVGGTRLTWTVPHHMTSPASGCLRCRLRSHGGRRPCHVASAHVLDAWLQAAVAASAVTLRSS